MYIAWTSIHWKCTKNYCTGPSPLLLLLLRAAASTFCFACCSAAAAFCRTVVPMLAMKLPVCATALFHRPLRLSTTSCSPVCSRRSTARGATACCCPGEKALYTLLKLLGTCVLCNNEIIAATQFSERIFTLYSKPRKHSCHCLQHCRCCYRVEYSHIGRRSDAQAQTPCRQLL
jgi:hypothetical protein